MYSVYTKYGHKYASFIEKRMFVKNTKNIFLYFKNLLLSHG